MHSMEMSPAPDHVDSLDNSSVRMSDDGNDSFMDPASSEPVYKVKSEMMIDTEQTQNYIENNNIAPVAAAPTPTPLIPCLRGNMTYVAGIVFCEGKWAMSMQAHDIPGQTSDFKFQLKKAEENGSFFPVNGMYEGWFNVKQAPPAKGYLKVEDKEMHLTFTADGDGGNYIIAGDGMNKFGKFRLNGTLSSTGKVEMYREYYIINPVAMAQTPKRVRSSSERKPRESNSNGMAMLDGTPREGRVRKQSALLKEYQETAFIVDNSNHQSNASLSQAVPLSRQISADRGHRLSAWLKKCSDLLKEISKHPQSVWFLEPVDHVSLNIPDYPRIVKSPMDLGTIRSKVEGNVYSSVESFAEDMRLVFNNAMLFNSSADHPVHVAAKELKSRFEERYRTLLRQVSSDDYVVGELYSKPKSTAATVPKKVRSSSSGYPAATTGNRNRLGVRVSSVNSMAGYHIPPPVMDASTHQIMEMQKVMMSMQDEIKALKANLREKEVKQRVVGNSREPTLVPLTYEEKQLLIKAIHKLPSHKMDEVLDIVHSYNAPSNDDEGEIEVSLDALDTRTLRHLQDFVEDYNAEQRKKRSFGSVSSPTAGRNNNKADGNKKRRKAPLPAEHYSGHAANQEHDLALFDVDEEDPLFVGDSMGEGVGNASAWENVHSTFNRAENEGEEDEEGENDWSEAAAEIRAKRPETFL